MDKKKIQSKKQRPNNGRKRKFDHKSKFKRMEKTWKLELEEMKHLKEKYPEINPSAVEKLTDFPLSRRTLEGLAQTEYQTPTEIQRESIGLALQGHDILGAAKTGSGKTLAFLIPVLECLYHQRWSQLDGLGALIITPTRELAYQIFQVLQKIGFKHDFSAGLVIGGKFIRDETKRINNTNIVICTPGRLLQHMDETFNFSADNLQILVLDEADRILDLGFQDTMNAIISNLPENRQTLLFSATQTKSVKDLARLSLKDPMYVSVHENAAHSTPTQLAQSYLVCELHQKLDLLWSFIKNHLKSKIMVFLSSCKQVKYVYEAFRKLRPGNSVIALHGGMNQLKRVDAYNMFCRKQHAVLLATDIAARGLDFPAVHWVVQLDCPEDANTYIHRVGRTARYETGGEALLILLPSEEAAMIQLLEEKKIPIQNIKVNPKRWQSIKGKLESCCAADVHFKEMAQRAFVAYLKAVFLMSDKKVFKVHALDTEQFASSLGLAFPPRVRFLQKDKKRLEAKQVAKDASLMQNVDSESKSNSNESDFSERNKLLQIDQFENSKNIEDGDRESGSDNESDNESDDDGSETCPSNQKDIEKDNSPNQVTKSEKHLEKKRNPTGSTEAAKEVLQFQVEDDDDDDGDSLFQVKKRIDPVISDEDEKECAVTLEKAKKAKAVTKAAVARKIHKKNLKVNTKILFNEEGEVIQDPLRTRQTALPEEEAYEGGIDIDIAKKVMQQEDKMDKQMFRERIKKRHKEERMKSKAARRAEDARRKGLEVEDEEPVAHLPSGDEDAAIDLLPDPDLVYGRKDTGTSSEDGENSSEEDEPTNKRARVSVSNEDSAESESEDGDEEEDESEDENDDLTLEDNEELALKLLQS